MLTRWFMKNWAVVLMLAVAGMLFLTLASCEKHTPPAKPANPAAGMEAAR